MLPLLPLPLKMVIISHPAQDVGILRANSEKEFQIMCSICATIWVMVDGALEPVMLCTQTLFGC